jgi:hypothetical protein
MTYLVVIIKLSEFIDFFYEERERIKECPNSLECWPLSYYLMLTIEVIKRDLKILMGHALIHVLEALVTVLPPNLFG